MLQVGAPFNNVFAENLGSGVSPAVNEAGPGAWIRTGVEGGQALDANAGNFLRGDLGTTEEKRIIEPVLAAQTRGAVSAEVDGPFAIGICREGELVDECWRKGAGEADRGDLVRPRPNFLHAAKGVLEGSIEVPRRIGAADREALGGVDQVIDLEGVLAQIGVSGLAADPIGRALQETWHRLREHVEQGLAVGADA